MSSPQIDLYTASTPNGWKVSVFLEEAGLPYNVHKIDLSAGDQKKRPFRVLKRTEPIRGVHQLK